LWCFDNPLSAQSPDHVTARGPLFKRAKGMAINKGYPSLLGRAEISCTRFYNILFPIYKYPVISQLPPNPCYIAIRYQLLYSIYKVPVTGSRDLVQSRGVV
jgi:hypothetical protein